MNNRFSYPALSVVLLAMCLAASPAHAHGDDDDDERHQKHDHHQHSQDERDRHAYTLNNPKLKAECGSCHVVYPPKMLPAASWHEIMQHLDKHFGTDASVDAATQSELGELFHHEAASRDETRSGKPVLRITETHWFQREHHEISARAWRNPKVKSASNCGACHTKAEEGRFGEHEVRIPR
ncbi:MAG: cytochrome C [Gallionella sp.]|nr:cytochrome C [Gallionella sp.]